MMTDNTSEVKCPTCRKTFKKTRYRKKYCSRECAQIGIANRPRTEALKYKDRYCKFCGNLFRSSRRDQKFCSKSCYYDYVKHTNKLRRRKGPNKAENILLG